MKLIKILVYSNFVVSLSVGVLTSACASLFNNKHPFIIGIVALLSTFFIYNIQRILRLKGIGEDSSERLLWIKRNALQLLGLSSLSVLSCLVLYFFVLGVEWDILFLGISAIFGILYAFEFTPNVEGLRDVPYIKIYLIAILWAMVTVIWPYIRDLSYDFPFALLFSVFFYILACTVPFDIRDVYYDDQQKRTIPQIFGQLGAKIIAVIFLVVSVVCLLSIASNLFSQIWFYLAYLGMFILIIFSNEQRPELYFSGGIDFWIVTYGILIFMLEVTV